MKHGSAWDGRGRVSPALGRLHAVEGRERQAHVLGLDRMMASDISEGTGHVENDAGGLECRSGRLEEALGVHVDRYVDAALRADMCAGLDQSPHVFG